MIRRSTPRPQPLFPIKSKDFILPLVFYKRLSDAFDDEVARYVEIYGSEELAYEIIEADHLDAIRGNRRPVVRFYIPAKYAWKKIRNHGADGRLGEFVTEIMREVAKLNPALKGVLDVKDFNERQSGQRTLDDDRLEALIEVLSEHRLGLANAEPDILGRAYEYLLRKFAEGQGQSAGEFYTPKEVGWLIAALLDPEPHSTIYDPACGSGGLLIKARLYFEEKHPDLRSKAPHLYGQELNPTTFAMAKMNMFLHDFVGSRIAIGDTLRHPAFAAKGAGSLRRFELAAANPMWNDDNFTSAFYEDGDHYDRFTRIFDGETATYPPNRSADWGWVQHLLASLTDEGRAAVVLDTGAVTRGSGTQQTDREREIRKAAVERDLIEAVVQLPDNLFYNTTAAGIVLCLNKNKPDDRRGEILLINASEYFEKGDPKNHLTDEGIRAAVEAYEGWEAREQFSHVLTLEEARAKDYNLSPSHYVHTGETVEHRLLPAIIDDLAPARRAREAADAELHRMLDALGLIEAVPAEE